MSHRLIRIGRARDNDVVLTHSSVSRYHLEAVIDKQGQVFITDKNSSNGTFINGNRISGQKMLNRGDILRLGAEKPLRWEEWIPTKQQAPPPYRPAVSAGQKGGGMGTGSVIAVVVLSVALVALMMVIAYVLHRSYKKRDPRIEAVQEDGRRSDEPDAAGEKGSDMQIPEPQTDNRLPEETDRRREKTETASNNKGPVSADDPSDEGPAPPVRGAQRNGKITYDFSCLNNPNDKNSTVILNMGSDIGEQVVDAYGKTVELSDEVSYGNSLHQELKKKYSFSGGDALNYLKQILQSLQAAIPNPRGFDYKIFLLQTDELNAFTAGGRIYMTTEMYRFCKSADELACVLGHEIYHNELGHIKNNIKMASIPGSEIIRLISTPFNQKKETACDFQGIDLAYRAGYDGCASVDVWRRMHQQVDKSSYDPLENLFRSHPYSSEREECSRNHISRNYLNAGCGH